MTTTEKLNAIKSKCEELLVLAERRTPGKWVLSNGGDDPESFPGIRTADGEAVVSDFYDFECGGVEGGAITAAFIAACAGSAEAGWLATIAAIRFLQNTDETGEGIELLNAILAAWEGLV